MIDGVFTGLFIMLGLIAGILIGDGIAVLRMLNDIEREIGKIED